MKLIRTSDTEPGYRRQRCGRGFRYLAPDGSRLAAGEDLDRIRSLAIPPAYRSVWICLPPNGHLQATGRDDRDRKQYRYHPEWMEIRNQLKFEMLLDFAHALPGIRRSLDGIIARRTLNEETATAVALAIIDRTGARVGNAAYRDEHGTYGITTLAREHAEIHGRAVELCYIGKHGKEVHLRLDQPALARHLSHCHELAGQSLFSYPDDDGTVRHVDSGMVNELIHELSCDEFSAKTFRTWRGSLLAFNHLATAAWPESARERKSLEVAAVRSAANGLFNTMATSRKYYVHPIITGTWMDGTFPALLEKAARSRAFSDLRTLEERRFARFLKVAG
ncbi:DNA topoisomerase IB [Haloferula sargassicola]|uniref:DNA topoisomerase n=1 Tax=Haloferula sargassicola TaxID=490096 RepID=A0ABP9UKK4_9BACT